jgi:hypothetical protein
VMDRPDAAIRYVQVIAFFYEHHFMGVLSDLSLGQGMSRARIAWRASFGVETMIKYCNVCLLQYIPNQIRIRVIGRDKKFFFIVNCNRYTV